MPAAFDLDLDRPQRVILYWMCVAITVNQLSFSAVVAVLPLYADNFGVSKTAVGMNIAVYGLARLLLNFQAGRMCDRLGRRPTLALGGLITAFGSASCALAPSFEWFLLARFVSGAGAALVLTAGQVIVADIAKPRSRGRVMALYQGVFLFTAGLGAFPGGWLAVHWNLEAPFWASSILAATVTVIAWFAVGETRRARTRDDTASRIHQATPSVLSLLRSEGLVLIAMVGLVATMGRTGALFNIIPLAAQNEMNLRPDQIGIGLGMISIMTLVFVYPSGVLVDRFGRKAVIVPSTMLTAASLAAFVAADGLAPFLLACAAWSMASGVSGAAPLAYATDVSPPNHVASALGLFRSLMDVGYVIGPLLLGAIADGWGTDAALWFTALLTFGVGLLFSFRARETLPKDVV